MIGEAVDRVFATICDSTACSAQKRLPLGGGTILRMVFAEDTAESQLRAILHRLPADIIFGPTENGIYPVALEPMDAESETLE